MDFGLRLDFYVSDRTAGLGNRLANFTHCGEVSSQGVLKIPAGFCFGVSDGRTSWHVRRERGEAGARRFDHHWVTPEAHFPFERISFQPCFSRSWITSRTRMGMTES